MKVKEIEISNFRSIAHCKIEFPDLIALIGENNAGKSNIINALKLFLNENKADKETDYLVTDNPIEITIHFTNLTAHEQEMITDTHRTGDDFIVKKSYPYNDNAITTSVKEAGETDMSPRGPQNILADTLPELYILPAIKEIPNEIKMTSTTNFGKLLSDVIDNTAEGFETADSLLTQLKEFFEGNNPDMPLNQISAEISEVLKKQFSTAEVQIAPKTLTRKEVLKSLDIQVNDGKVTSIYQKGHGLQRAVIFAILCLWANRLNEARPADGKEKKGIIIKELKGLDLN